ncbi:lysine acetyltransferase protein [Penicillium psychrosexuale]|uniref:lysine acetyltransferase protein n=1 Tax=Penicillium psychrosexuale TaxID=1002107 RepID=UPI00254580F2|nr:lysine acetyltransferase protein [Penicillium psychrosexuale]KAJ5799672.1 lysine acetyltransferase protein [Penicillium psychrosexuale]
MTENIVHGIASVFTPPHHRRQGYAARLMKELANILYGWQSEHLPCVGSILYSDIGPSYYTKLGWHVNATNSHYTFNPARIPWPSEAKGLSKTSLVELCDRDETMIRDAMKTSANVERRVVIIPDIDHMLWHIEKEQFMSELFLGKIPLLKGAIAGPPGNQIWVVWTHCYYSHPEEESNENGLNILRLVVENEHPGSVNYDELLRSLKAVIHAAQWEANEWKLDYVNLWEPSKLVKKMIEKSGISHDIVEREDEAIACGMWYDQNGIIIDAPLWVNNERYAYC